MLGEIGGIVPAGIEMKFVRDVARRKGFVERRRAGFEAVVVAIAAVEVDLQAHQIGRVCQRNRTIAIPESGIGRRPAQGRASAEN